MHSKYFCTGKLLMHAMQQRAPRLALSGWIYSPVSIESCCPVISLLSHSVSLFLSHQSGKRLDPPRRTLPALPASPPALFLLHLLLPFHDCCYHCSSAGAPPPRYARPRHARKRFAPRRNRAFWWPHVLNAMEQESTRGQGGQGNTAFAAALGLYSRAGVGGGL